MLPELLNRSGGTAAAFCASSSAAASGQQGWLIGTEGPGEEKILRFFPAKPELKAEWG